MGTEFCIQYEQFSKEKMKKKNQQILLLSSKQVFVLNFKNLHNIAFEMEIFFFLYFATKERLFHVKGGYIYLFV